MWPRLRVAAWELGLMEDQMVNDETATHSLEKRLNEKDQEISRLQLQLTLAFKFRNMLPLGLS
jgi:hypothetical protein